MKWLDIEEIAEALQEEYPEFDILSVRFTALRKMITDLEGFNDEDDKCNEKILEAIQANWLELREEE